MSDLTAQQVAAIRARAEAGHGFGTWSPTTVVVLCDLAAKAIEFDETDWRARALKAEARNVEQTEGSRLNKMRRMRATAQRERDEARATIERVRALAERWRYKGEHGWGPWQEGYGPSPEDDVLDHAAADLRRVLDNKGENGQ